MTNHDEKKELVSAFHEIDTDHDGLISRNDLTVSFKKMLKWDCEP